MLMSQHTYMPCYGSKMLGYFSIMMAVHLAASFPAFSFGHHYFFKIAEISILENVNDTDAASSLLEFNIKLCEDGDQTGCTRALSSPLLSKHQRIHIRSILSKLYGESEVQSILNFNIDLCEKGDSSGCTKPSPLPRFQLPSSIASAIFWLRHEPQSKI